MIRPGLIKTLLVLVAIMGAGGGIYYWQQTAPLRRNPVIVDQEAFDQHREAVQEIRPLRPGDRLPDFAARDMDGREVRVAARGWGKSLLLIYNPGCSVCEENYPAWATLSDKLKSLEVEIQIIALSVADSQTTVQHARVTGMPFAVVPFPSDELRKQYGVTRVPLTVVVDSQGVVEAVWNRALDQAGIDAIVDLLK